MPNAQIIRNGKGEVIALYPLMPNRTTVDRDEHDQLYYSYQMSNEDAPTMKTGTVVLKPRDVLHVPGLGFGRAGGLFADCDGEKLYRYGDCL